jgi:hypothetical protein
MKMYPLFIVAISACILSGCSTKGVAKYEGNPIPHYQRPPTSGDFDTHDELYVKVRATADLVLETKNWDSFEETVPAHATVKREALGDLLRNQELFGHEVAVVVIPQYGPPFEPGEESPNNKVLVEIRQSLKNAGFVHIYFFARMYGMIVPIP